MNNPYPIISKYVKTYSEYERMKVKLIIGTDSIVSKPFLFNPTEVESEYIDYFDGTVLNISNLDKRERLKNLLKAEINEETKILINDNVDLKILPISPNSYNIIGNEEIRKDSIHVIPQLGEKTLNELIQNNFKYKLDWKTKSFKVVNKSTYLKYFFKHRIRERLLSTYGDELDRLADLSEMILRLANHVNSIKEIEDKRLIKLLDSELEIKSSILDIIFKEIK